MVVKNPCKNKNNHDSEECRLRLRVKLYTLLLQLFSYKKACTISQLYYA